MAYEFLNDLNKEQYEAATFNNGYELILAGAGTGKTKTLISRVAYLIKKGIPASSILLLTFTRTAADEMRDKLTSIIGPSGANIKAQTFHGWCFNFLKEHGNKINKQNFIQLQNQDALDIIKQIRKEKIYDIQEIQRQQKEKHTIINDTIDNDTDYTDIPSDTIILACHSYAVEHITDIKTAVDEKLTSSLEDETEDYEYEYENNNPIKFKKEILEILEEYENKKNKENKMDFDDLLKYTYDILSFDDALCQYYNQKYQYVMCDEYQDTDLIQNEILTLITQYRKNLVVVGDDNQSIYRFRNAIIGNILNFNKFHIPTHEITLYQNYRSTQEILDLANAVMNHRTEGKEKILKNNKHGNKPLFLKTDNQFEEAKQITDYIKQLHSNGIPYEEIAVISRNSKPLLQIEAQLKTNKIDCVIYGGKSFFEKETVRDIIAILRVLLHIEYRDSLIRICCLMHGVKDKKANDILDVVEEVGLRAIAEGRELNSYQYSSQLKYIAQLLITLETKSVQEIFDILINKGAYKQIRDNADKVNPNIPIGSTPNDKNHKRIKDQMILLPSFCVFAENYTDLATFYDDLMINSDPATARKNKKNKVVLSTIHSVKGLEFNTVFLIQVQQGTIPSNFVKDDKDPDAAIAEELRCLYVALTRAKENLIVSVPEYSLQYTSNSEYRKLSTTISQFLNHKDVMECFDIKQIQKNKPWY